MTRLILASLLCVLGIASAGTTVTETKGDTVLHAADNTSVTLKDKPDAPSHKACVLAAQAKFKGPGPELSKCWDETAVLVQLDCSDVKAPHIALVKNADGSWLEPDSSAFPVAGSDTEWTTLQWLYVHNATWPQGYPDCWVRGWTAPEEWRVNGTDPNAVFMEKLEQGMADLPDGPTSVEPYYLPGEEPKA